MQNKHTVAVATSGTHNKPLIDDYDDESSCVLAACFITVRKTEKKRSNLKIDKIFRS